MVAEHRISAFIVIADKLGNVQSEWRCIRVVKLEQITRHNVPC